MAKSNSASVNEIKYDDLFNSVVKYAETNKTSLLDLYMALNDHFIKNITRPTDTSKISNYAECEILFNNENNTYKKLTNIMINIDDSRSAIVQNLKNIQALSNTFKEPIKNTEDKMEIVQNNPIKYMDGSDNAFNEEPMQAKEVSAKKKPAKKLIKETIKAEPVKAEPVKAEPKAEPVKAEPIKAEPIKAEPVKAEPKAEPVKKNKKSISTIKTKKEETSDNSEVMPSQPEPEKPKKVIKPKTKKTPLNN
jgi:hypothetical protein